MGEFNMGYNEQGGELGPHEHRQAEPTGFAGADTHETLITPGPGHAEAEAGRPAFLEAEPVAEPEQPYPAPDGPPQKWVEGTMGRLDDPTISCNAWSPENLQWQADNGTGVTEIITDRPRLVLPELLNKAAAFNANLDERATNGQDCMVFAYACTTGIDVNGMRFGGNDGLQLARNMEILAESPQEAVDSGVVDSEPPGTVIMITSSAPGEDILKGKYWHYLVKVSIDDNADNGSPPLYISKFGTNGPVAVTTLSEAMRFYPTQRIGIVRNMTLLPPKRRDVGEPF